MKLVPIEVECYSGYKADEYPKCFTWKEENFCVEKILDRWYQTEENQEGPAADYYKVRTNHNRIYILKHLIMVRQWYLVR